MCIIVISTEKTSLLHNGSQKINKDSFGCEPQRQIFKFWIFLSKTKKLYFIEFMNCVGLLFVT